MQPVRGPVIVATALPTTLAYLGLAVLGWRGFAAFFAHPALTALTIATALMAAAALFTSGNLSPGEREDRSNRWVIAAFAIIGLLDGYLPALTDRLGVWTLDGAALRWLGVILFAAGGTLRIWPVFVLGRRFSGVVAIQPGHTLATTGVYGVIRHPSYLGLLVMTLGWGLAFRSGSVCCWRRLWCRCCWRAFTQRSGRWRASSAPPTMPTARAPRG